MFISEPTVLLQNKCTCYLYLYLIFNHCIKFLYISEVDCFTPETQYNGKLTCTTTGTTCQVWTSDFPHISNYKRFGDNNFCRQSSNYDPWCYTLDENTRWDYCSVPKCNV